jgi:hypothetical protein
VETISDNPVPSALVGIGLAWLLMNGRSDSARVSRRYPQRARGEWARGAATQVRETGSQLADRARETTSGMIDQAHHAADYVSEQAHYQVRRVEERFDSAMRESPLAVGAIALALGTAVGVVVPQTRRENQLMGETRDALMDKAQTVAHDAMEQVQEVAEQAKESADNGASKGSSERQQTVR